MLSVEDVRVPRHWEIWAGADTGTYMSGLIAALDPQTFDLFPLEEHPNYHYTGDGSIELLDITVGEWMRHMASRLQYWTRRKKTEAWADANTTFKSEVAHGFRFRMNSKPLELRTEITREYVRNGRVHMPSWLTTLPYEMEEAKFPEHETAGGRFQRVKEKDHTLDCLEHICSRRPHPKFRLARPSRKGGIHALVAKHRRVDVSVNDPHLGAN